MARIPQAELEKAKEQVLDIQVLTIPGKGQVFIGPYLKDGFDSYTECLFANSAHKRNEDMKVLGLNEHGQTKEQQKDFENRKRTAIKRKEQAEVASEMLAHAGAK